MLEVLSSGFPHSDTRGSADMCSSPRLFAAYHVLLRLPVPRHSPCALLQLTSVRYCFLTFRVFFPLGSSEPPSGTSAISPAVPCTSVYMVFCLSAPSRAAMCGLFFLPLPDFFEFYDWTSAPLALRFHPILDSFPICCLRILHRDCYPFYVMSSCPLRVQEAHASRGMWLRLFRPVRKRPAVSAVSTHHFEDTCVCSFQGTSMPSSFCVRPLPS